MARGLRAPPGCAARGRRAARSRGWPGEMERRSLSLLRLDPHPPPPAVHQLLHDREPDPGALDFVPRGERMEDAEDALMVLLRDTGPVVAHGALEGVALTLRRDADPGPLAGPVL